MSFMEINYCGKPSLLQVLVYLSTHIDVTLPETTSLKDDPIYFPTSSGKMDTLLSFL